MVGAAVVVPIEGRRWLGADDMRVIAGNFVDVFVVDLGTRAGIG